MRTDGEVYVPVPTNSKALDTYNVNFRTYSREQVIELAARFLATNNMRQSARALGINEGTALQYRARDWWEPLLQEIRDHFDDGHRAGLGRIVNTGIREMEDRLLNGDPVLTKDGDTIRVPVKLRDAVYATGISLDKLTAMRKRYEVEADTQKELARLAHKFEELSGQVNATVIEHDADVSDTSQDAVVPLEPPPK